jgi:hypothetical protein
MDEIRPKRRLKDPLGLDAEFLQEIAEALGNAGERLDRAIGRVEASARRVGDLRQELVAASAPEEREAVRRELRAELQRHEALRHEALEQYHWFLVHREAVGLRNHRIVAQQYRVPEAIRMEEKESTRG